MGFSQECLRKYFPARISCLQSVCHGWRSDVVIFPFRCSECGNHKQLFICITPLLIANAKINHNESVKRHTSYMADVKTRLLFGPFHLSWIYLICHLHICEFVTASRRKYIVERSLPANKITVQRISQACVLLLTQKCSAVKPGILLCEAPTSCKYWKKTSSSSRLRIPSSSVSMTLLACSASSSDVACCSFVFSSLNFSNKPISSACSSNSLEEEETSGN